MLARITNEKGENMGKKLVLCEKPSVEDSAKSISG